MNRARKDRYIMGKSGGREEGVVRWFNNEKGFGFIARDGRKDLFVHYSAIEGTGFRSLSEGDQISFIVVQGEKGEQAAEVRVTARVGTGVGKS